MSGELDKNSEFRKYAIAYQKPSARFKIYLNQDSGFMALQCKKDAG